MTPHVVIDPRMKCGTPCLSGRRLPAELIADRYWELGEDMDTEILENYDITRADVLACCFWAATYGTRRQRRRWRVWLTQTWLDTGLDNETREGRGWWSEDWQDVPMPPTKRQSATVPGGADVH